MHRRATIRAAVAFLAGAVSSGPSWVVQASSQPLRLAYFVTFSPLSFYGNGALRGILVGMLGGVFARLSVSHLHEGFLWPRAQAFVQRGQCDAICTIATPQRLECAEAADEPVATTQACIFVREDDPMLPRVGTLQANTGLRRDFPALQPAHVKRPTTTLCRRSA